MRKPTHLALTSGRRHAPQYYVQLNKRDYGRHYLTQGEEWRILLLADHGYSYKYIAQRVFGNGNPNFKVSKADIGRVGRVLSKNKRRVRDWRNCQTQ